MTRLILGCFIVFVFVCPVVGNGQQKIKPVPTGSDTDLWTWTEEGKHHDSVVKIIFKSKNYKDDDKIEIRIFEATGFVAFVDKTKRKGSGYYGLCITADHLFRDEKREGDKMVFTRIKREDILVKYRNKNSFSNDCKLLSYDEKHDVAVVRVWVPDGIEALSLASKKVKPGDFLEFVGLGGGSQLNCCLRHFSSKADDPTTEHAIFAADSLIQGDSGGPVFNKERKVVGVISGGWFWYPSGVTKKITTSEKSGTGTISVRTRIKRIKTTWPAKACGLTPTKKILAKGIEEHKKLLKEGK